MDSFNVSQVISDIRAGKQIQEPELYELLTKLQEILFTENNIIEVSSPVFICGDIHGQLYDLFELFDAAAPNGISNQKFLFMGDYVDRGHFSIETFAYLAAHKVKYPNQFFLLRGNHECRKVNESYGFYDQTLLNYGHSGVWMLANETFDLLPMAALVDGKVFSIHGGLSPDVTFCESVALLDRQDELPRDGPLCDLCWSDPDADVDDYEKSQRGAGFIFGERQVKEFCYNNGLNLITRSHQLAMNGYEWFFDHQLITVWSAPNYMYRSKNKATVLKYDPSEKDDCRLIFFDACPNNKRKVPIDPAVSTYFL